MVLRWSLLVATVIAVPAAAQPARARRPAWPANASPGDWQLPGRDYGSTRFSPLDQIGVANVAQLKPAWKFETGQPGAHEGNPLVAGRMMYLHSPFPNKVFALDLTRPGSPPVWSYPTSAPATRLTPATGCCDGASPGLAYHPSGKLFVSLLHGDLAALDAKTGRQLWRVKNADPTVGYSMAGAPLVAKDLVLVGTAGSEFGARGYLTAYETATGRQVWRAYHTGPDAEVLIENEANSQYSSHRGRDLGVTTWPGDEWRRGGATASGWISFDPTLDLLFYGTDHPGSYDAARRRGDNKWSNTIFARALSTGTVRWAYQITPHDEWGYDGSNESLVVDLTMGGARTKALVHFDRNGFAYTLDRSTGKVQLTERFGPANWAIRIDAQTAQPIPDPRYRWSTAGVRGVCPAASGAKGHQPAAFSPATSLFYVPVSNLCMDLTPTPATSAPGRPYPGAVVKLVRGTGPNQGRLIAWDAATGAVAWQNEEPYPVMSGTLATAGGLIFYGTLDGWLKAVDHRSGRELWRFKTPSGIVGNPITFLGPDEKQYVAVLSGLGDSLAQALARAIPDLKSIPINQSGVLTVFGL